MSYSAYLQKISPDQLFIRPKEDLTYEFWGSSEAVPSVSLTGAQNIALLVQGQMETATKRYPIVFNITKIWKTDKVPLFILRILVSFVSFRVFILISFYLGE